MEKFPACPNKTHGKREKNQYQYPLFFPVIFKTEAAITKKQASTAVEIRAGETRARAFDACLRFFSFLMQHRADADGGGGVPISMIMFRERSRIITERHVPIRRERFFGEIECLSSTGIAASALNS